MQHNNSDSPPWAAEFFLLIARHSQQKACRQVVFIASNVCSVVKKAEFPIWIPDNCWQLIFFFFNCWSKKKLNLKCDLALFFSPPPHSRFENLATTLSEAKGQVKWPCRVLAGLILGIHENFFDDFAKSAEKVILLFCVSATFPCHSSRHHPFCTPTFFLLSNSHAGNTSNLFSF